MLRQQARRWVIAWMLLPALIGFVNLNTADAHAELVSATPAIDSIVPTLPASLDLVFSEEVKPGGVTVTVTGPDGARIDTGDAQVDLTNATRTLVHVSLFSGGNGVYNVAWQSTSNLDGDVATGSYSFAVGNEASPTMGGAVVASPIPTPDPDANGNPLSTDSNFDGRALALSVGAGLLAALAIFGVWLAIRPKNPKFGSRSKPD
ncbi:MAG TPA: copper resistance protein CopC [Thermomicrobiales bacterium]|nr:copper resistance protein CopC [Thermomicrobiales bacterium]